MDLLERMERWVRAHPNGAVIHSAAVGDYGLADAETGKLPSGQDQVILRLVPMPKIADRIREWGLKGRYVTFKAAPPDTADDALVEIARAQRSRTACDLVLANVLGRLDEGVWIVGEAAARFEDRKDAIAALAEAVIEG